LAQKGELTISSGGKFHSLQASTVCRPDLLACAAAGWLPDVLIVCTQPDQLLPMMGDYVKLLELLYAQSDLESAVGKLPLLVLSSNGIYHERVRRFLVELLEESMLYGRLPDLWSQSMGQIVGKLMRGVTIQTGHREGSGANAVFHAGPPGRTTLAGGDATHRRQCQQLLQSLGGWFENAETAPPIRVEFDKALVNLWSNLLGQLNAIDEHGTFRLLRIKDIYAKSSDRELRELSGHLFSIGRAVRAYRDDEDLDNLHNKTLQVALVSGDHYPSSLKWIDAQLQAGTLTPQLTPTEQWLIDPLTHYARTAGLEAAAQYFTSLKQRIELGLAAAIASYQRKTEES
jgi:hypothetical protein